jgi:hypothetical protein
MEGFENSSIKGSATIVRIRQYNNYVNLPTGKSIRYALGDRLRENVFVYQGVIKFNILWDSFLFPLFQQ